LERLDIANAALIEKAAWSHAAVIPFGGAGRGASGAAADITPGMPKTVSADSIDHTAAGFPVTFMKLDVEGAEREVLLGAVRVLRRYRPRLSVSLYHRPEDIFALPLLVRKIYPRRAMYVRRALCVPAWEVDLLIV
jgi:FkbM family methyltransferase